MTLNGSHPAFEIVPGDPGSALPVLQSLRRMGGLAVGDNEPYSGSLAGDTLNTHATARGLPHLLIEIRQDLVQSKSGVDEWTSRLAQVLEPFMKNASIRQLQT